MRTIKSFAIRNSRITKVQKYALEHYAEQFLLQLPLDITTPFWHTSPVVMEIGFGNGSSLIQMCKQHPHIHYLGVEVYLAGIGNIMHHAYQHKLTNLKVLNDDAVEVIHTLPHDSLSGLQLYFPDPWHKKKHHKRRLVCTAFIANILPKLKNSALIYMATDWQDYAYQMLEVLSHTPELRNMHTDFAKVTHRSCTKFEHRAKRLGHRIWDLEFKVVK